MVNTYSTKLSRFIYFFFFLTAEVASGHPTAKRKTGEQDTRNPRLEIKLIPPSIDCFTLLKLKQFGNKYETFAYLYLLNSNVSFHTCVEMLYNEFN